MHYQITCTLLKEMTVKISLRYFINKNKISLEQFCIINKVKDYKSLVALCNIRKLSPITLGEFEKEFTLLKNNNKIEKHEKKKVEKVITKPKRRYTRKKSKK